MTTPFDLYSKVASLYDLDRQTAKYHLFYFLYGVGKTKSTGDLLADCCTYMEALGFKKKEGI